METGVKETRRRATWSRATSRSYTCNIPTLRSVGRNHIVSNAYITRAKAAVINALRQSFVLASVQNRHTDTFRAKVFIIENLALVFLCFSGDVTLNYMNKYFSRLCIKPFLFFLYFISNLNYLNCSSKI